MTTGAPVDTRRAPMPSYILMRDGICSQHDLRVVDSLWLAPSAVAAFARSWRALKGEKPRT